MISNLIHSSKCSDFTPQVVGDVEVTSYRDTLNELLHRRKAKGLAKLLATPMEKPDSPGILDWYTDLEGPFTALSEIPEKKKYLEQIKSLAHELQEQAKILSAFETRRKRQASLILESISSSMEAYVDGKPSALEFFLSGDDLVMANWGLDLRKCGAPVGECPSLVSEVHDPHDPHDPQDTLADELVDQDLPPVSVSEPKQIPKAIFGKLAKVGLGALLLLILLALIFLVVTPGLKGLISENEKAPSAPNKEDLLSGSSERETAIMAQDNTRARKAIRIPEPKAPEKEEPQMEPNSPESPKSPEVQPEAGTQGPAQGPAQDEPLSKAEDKPQEGPVSTPEP